jgi:hypothetical protein
MSVTAVLVPVFALVALSFVLQYWMGYLRVTAVWRGQVHTRDIALRQQNWPVRATQVGNAYHNILEQPLLFYVLVAFALTTRKADLVFVVMSWIYVTLRLLHAYIFVTTNRVSRRFYMFMASSVVLLLMWIIFAAQILLAI